MNTTTLIRLAMCSACLFSASLSYAASALYVSPKGEDDNKGTKGSPMTLAAAVKEMSEEMKAKPKTAPRRIYLQGGLYSLETPVVLGEEIQGTEENPVIIAPLKGEKVIFDGSKQIPIKSFKKVKRSTDRARLAKSAVDDIYVATIEDPSLIKIFAKTLMLQLNMNGKSYQPAVFPNEGYALFVEETVTPEVSPPAVPVGKSAYGVRAGHVPYLEEGKERGFLGTLKEPRGARARIQQEAEMAGTWQQWEDELKVTNERNSMSGYFDADWCFSSMPLYAASAEDRCVHLSRVLAYGWGWRKNDKRFRVFGMLCELDQPGEWYYDVESKQLFIYPVAKMDAKAKVSLSIANGFMNLNGCEHVTVKGLSVRNLASGVAYRLAGSHNTVAGASISNSTASGVSLEGQDNSLISCDIYDLSQHIRLGGGKRSADVFEAGNNLVENCHIYQKENTHQKVGVGISGVGNIFRHNMVHNSLGQAVTLNGNDHLMEFNEFFNIGYEEGDGGAVYAGADVSGYGTVYRYNFFHHLIHNPGKVERSGLFMDDMQAGATIYGNIFYKSAGKGVHCNGGAGHTMYDNLFLDGYRGIYFVGVGDKMYKIEQAIQADPQSHYIGTKEDYIGRAEKMLGKEFWTKSPWKDKYPKMVKVLSDSGQYGRLWGIGIDITNNYGKDNKYTTIADGRIPKQAMEKNHVEPYKEIKSTDFVDYDKMDFRFRNKSAFPEIPFAQIGLKKDEYRSEVPNKSKYRRAIREFYRGVKSMPGIEKPIDTTKLMED